jgi:NADH-quinone oxidoreductase subunit L
VTHAFFKACLFLGAGSVMHGMGDETDIRKMGGLAKQMPHTHWTFLVATIAATGILPLSGYWSKDAILGNALFSHNPAWHEVGPIAYAVGSLAALGTAFYMTRLYWLTFRGKARTHAAEHAHESSPVMTVPLMVLAVLAAGCSDDDGLEPAPGATGGSSGNPQSRKDCTTVLAFGGLLDLGFGFGVHRRHFL